METHWVQFNFRKNRMSFFVGLVKKSQKTEFFFFQIQTNSVLRIFFTLNVLWTKKCIKDIMHSLDIKIG